MDWYPRKPQSYRNDTWGLTLAEHGAYSLLLDYYYSSENPLPENDNAIAGIIGCTLSEWLEVKENVTRYFTVTNGRLIHEICDNVIQTQLKRRKDGADRIAKYREKLNKINCNDGVTGYKRVSNAPKGKERKGKEKKDKTIIRFDDFWSIYPLKVGKQGALAKYKVAIKSVSEDTLIEGAKKYAEFVKIEKTDSKYIAHATTWLNQGRWEDELVESNKIADIEDPVQKVFAIIERDVGRDSALNWENAYHAGDKSAIDIFYKRRGQK